MLNFDSVCHYGEKHPAMIPHYLRNGLGLGWLKQVGKQALQTKQKLHHGQPSGIDLGIVEKCIHKHIQAAIRMIVESLGNDSRKTQVNNSMAWYFPAISPFSHWLLNGKEIILFRRNTTPWILWKFGMDLNSCRSWEQIPHLWKKSP